MYQVDSKLESRQSSLSELGEDRKLVFMKYCSKFRQENDSITHRLLKPANRVFLSLTGQHILNVNRIVLILVFRRSLISSLKTKFYNGIISTSLYIIIDEAHLLIPIRDVPFTHAFSDAHAYTHFQIYLTLTLIDYKGFVSTADHYY